MLPLLLLQLVLQLPPPAPPPPPGAPAVPRVNPRLAFSAAYSGNALELTFRNDGLEGLYVQLGSIIGRRALLNMEITRADGGAQVIDWSAPTAVAGRIDPLAIFLMPGARYIHHIPTTLLHDTKTKDKIAVAATPPKLRVLFRHQPVTADDAYRLDLVGAGIWTGALTATTP